LFKAGFATALATFVLTLMLFASVSFAQTYGDNMGVGSTTPTGGTVIDEVTTGDTGIQQGVGGSSGMMPSGAPSTGMGGAQ
jgi:hypothetical protein